VFKISKILIVGCGALGGHILELLSRVHGVKSITVLDINEEWGKKKVNNAIFGSTLQGFYPKIEFIKADLFDIDNTAEILKKVGPDLIYQTSTLQSPYQMHELPKKVYSDLLEAGFGPWLPMHLTLPLKLMKACKKAHVGCHVINLSYPDVTHAVLSKIGLAPTVGAGNIDLLTPKIQKVISDMKNIPMANINVRLVGHFYHYASVLEKGTIGDLPIILRVYFEGEDITDELSVKDIFKEVQKRCVEPKGTEVYSQVASSAIKNGLAMLNDENKITNAPGPLGLIGGYPVRLNERGCELCLPADVTLGEAVKINEMVQSFDGIEQIKDDGTVVFTDKAHEIMKSILDYDCKELSPEESEEKAKELGEKYKKLSEALRTR